jgi:hypothetical protein
MTATRSQQISGKAVEKKTVNKSELGLTRMEKKTVNKSELGLTRKAARTRYPADDSDVAGVDLGFLPIPA